VAGGLARDRRHVLPASSAILREPCPSWPVWNAKITAGLARFAEAMRPRQTAPAPQPVPQPLAVIAAGSPVEDLIARLARSRPCTPEPRSATAGAWKICPAAPSQATSERQARTGHQAGQDPEK
jgi:hypothetical protein